MYICNIDNCSIKIGEKMILLSAIGGLEALKEGKVTIDEMGAFLFAPRMYYALKEKGYSKNVLHIIEEGCELEDFESLLPDKLNSAIDDMKREALLLLDDYEEFNCYNWLVI